MLIKTKSYIRTLCILTLSIWCTANAQNTAEIKPESSPMPAGSQVQVNKDGVAIDGFDPVAYFNKGKAVKGLSTHSCEYRNITWHFSSAENRDKFLANPEKFSPQYGGFCAYSLSKNKIIHSDPKSFSIRDDKLYLYNNKRLAKKDAKAEKESYTFNQKVRDKNWLTYQSNF